MADKKISELPASTALDLDDFLAVVEDGTTVQATIEDILALSTSSGLPDGYSVPAFTQSVLTDQTAAMTAAIDALPDDGGTVLVPAGIFYTQLLIDSHSNMTFRGAGMDATTIRVPVANTLVIPYGTPRGNYTFEDMTFDMATEPGPNAMVVYPEDQKVTFRRCRFIAAEAYCIGLNGSVGTVIEDCEFDDGGMTYATAVTCVNAVQGLRWIRSKVRFMDQGLVFDSTPHDDIDIDGGLFDGGWYLLRDRGAGYANSGGTVTYGVTTLTDSAASFATLPTPYDVNVRVLPVLETGSTGTDYEYNYLSDAGATFVSNNVHPGYIVRTATQWAVVSSVFSETKLYVEEWFDSDTYRPTSQPTADEAYTVYRVLIGVVVSNTATGITVERWIDFYDGDDVTPASGTLYEVLIDHGEYCGIHASASSHDLPGAIRNIRVHGGCHLTRTWNDQLSIYGCDARLTVDETVLIDHGQDFGITCHGERARVFCTAVHNGACNIYLNGPDSRVGAYVSGAPWVNTTNQGWLGDLIISNDRTNASGTVAVASGAKSRYGIVVACIADPQILTGVDVSNTSVSGYTNAAEYKLYGYDTACIVDTVLRNVSGAIEIDPTDADTGTVDWVSTSEVQTTAGAAGAAAALPATPTKYVKITVAGVDYVIPAYALFDPIADIAWTAAYWAGGPEFVALGLAADAQVSSFPDEVSTLDLAQATSGDRPLYRTTGGPNGTPAIHASSADIILRASTPSIAQPFTMVAIGESDNASGDRVLVCGDSSIGQIYQSSSNQWAIYAGGAEVKAGTPDTNPHLFVGFFNGASSKLDIDGTEVISGNPGSTGLAGFHIFGGASGSWDGKCSFAACYSGDARTDTNWALFESWVTSGYGITIA